jgi:hypothetical protein
MGALAPTQGSWIVWIEGVGRRQNAQFIKRTLAGRAECLFIQGT